MKALCVIAVCILMVIEVDITSSCSPTQNWRPQSFLIRMESAEIAFQGKVIHAPSAIPLYGLYTVKFEVECVYKTSLPISKEITVSGFGYDGGMCSSTSVTVGGNYIVFVRAPYQPGGAMSIDMINIQSAAATASPSLLGSVQQLYSCEKPE